MNMEKEEYLTVSEKFVDIYKMFNVVNQTEKMKELSRKELMLMLVLGIDSFSEDNPAVIENFRQFKSELEIIYYLHEDKECTDEDLLQLGGDTDEKYIDTSRIRDSKGEELSKALSDGEALQLRREISIHNIID